MHTHNHAEMKNRHNHVNHESTTNAVIALKKAQTHIKNILQMIEADAYCIDILQQILSVNGLIKSASDKILQNHLHTCFISGMSTKETTAKKEKLIQEVISVVSLNNKSK